MARRLGEPGALTAALMALHAALLYVKHAQERRRVADQALALAGELGARELAALGRHWLIYDLADERASWRRRGAGTPSSSSSPLTSSNSRSTVTHR